MAIESDPVFYHEDDYCQQEILPLSAVEFCQDQIADASAFSEAHRCDDGMGWTDVYQLSSPPQSLAELHIHRDRFAELMGQLPARDVFTGYGATSWLCEKTVGYGFDGNCVVFAEWDESGEIQRVWTHIFSDDEAKRQAVIESLQGLGSFFPLLYVDWAWGFAVPLDQSSKLGDQIRTKVEQFTERLAKPFEAQPQEGLLNRVKSRFWALVRWVCMR